MRAEKQPVEERDVCAMETGIETDVEDGDVDIVGGVTHVGVSGYESEGFTVRDPS